MHECVRGMHMYNAYVHASAQAHAYMYTCYFATYRDDNACASPCIRTYVRVRVWYVCVCVCMCTWHNIIIMCVN